MAIERRKKDPIVYSSDKGRICPSCGLPVSECAERKEKPKPKGDGIVRIQKESKGRRGKTVTAIRGLPLDDNALQKLASKLKHRCGTGGTAKDGTIEIQGDHCALLLSELKELGYTVKRAGG